ncbi:lasso peptide biosynthesis B2 protein [Rhizomicrobium electricum]|uniref:Lasso peptide biosynthesis B2 protein n=1 Tax=Rhizomicrobium electricum TaxID=480070 RepID=A0ABN1F7Y7_9PROT|nr:lasso peptide biosynthesis B2 protein [Rhizomicrobium electricum]NIJ46725.1 hypothetical protein [Rhizomicrobium electricum]
MIAKIRYWLGAAETVPTLAIAWALVFVVPFRWTARWFGGAVAPSMQMAMSERRIANARYVARRLQRVAAHMPWRTTCLVRAIAGALMLKRRGIPSTIRFGVNRADGGLSAHAWLLVGDTIVLGGEIAPEYQPLADMGDKS